MEKDELAQAIEFAVMALAKLVAEQLRPESLVANEPALPLKVLRRRWRRKVFTEAAEKTWDTGAKEILSSQLATTDGPWTGKSIDVDGFKASFIAAFVLFSEGQLSDAPGRVKPSEWESSREQPDAAVVPQGADVSSYVLAYDATLGRVVFATSEGSTDFGVSWSWDGTSWQKSNRLALSFGGYGPQPLQGFYDPTRGGVAGWTLVPGDGESKAVGVLVTEQSADPIEQSGEIPTGSLDTAFETGVIFGFDESRDVTVALGREDVWEMARDGVWKHVYKVPPELRGGRKWFSGTSGAIFDPMGARTIFYWVDWDESDFLLRTWNGVSIAKLGLDGLPKRVRHRHGVAFYRGADGAVEAFTGNGGQTYRLQGADWNSAGEFTGSPTAFSGVRAARDPSAQVATTTRLAMPARSTYSTSSLMGRGGASASDASVQARRPHGVSSRPRARRPT